MCGPGTHVVGDECVADAAAGGRSDGGAPDLGTASRDDLGPSNDDAGGTNDGGSDGTTDLGAPPATSGSAVTYQIDPAHSGGQPDSALRPPIVSRWSVTLGSTYLSYPLIVGDRVFVTGSVPNDARLYALSAADGANIWGPLTITTAAYHTAYAAWDDGNLFVIDGTGTVQMIDAAGTPAGRTRSPTMARLVRRSPPSASSTSIFGETLFALDERDGTIRWQGGDGGQPTSPAWTPDTVILNYIAGGVSAFSPSDGGLLWRDDCHCSGGGGAVPVVYDGRVYAPDSLSLTEHSFYTSMV